MRLLFLSQGRKIEDHPGYDEGLRRLLNEGVLSHYQNLPYIGFAEQHGYEALWAEIIRQARGCEANAVYFQYFHRKANPNPARCIEALRKLPQSPVIVTSCGDAFSSNWMWPHFPESFKICARMSDLTFSTQMGRTADKMLAWGIRNIVLLPHALCQVRFKVYQEEAEMISKDFDVVWVGSRARRKPNIWNKVFWNGRNRARLVHLLSAKYGTRFGLFGYNWEGNPSWQGAIPFNEQQAAFRRGRVIVDAISDPFGDRYYTSDRPFFALASGVPVILFDKTGLDRLFKPGEHAYYARNADDLLTVCTRILESDPEELRLKALATAKLINERHTQYHRMKFAMEQIQRCQTAKAVKKPAQVPELPYFLPDVDVSCEIKEAVRGWIG